MLQNSGRSDEPLHIVIAGSEAFPFAKTGGLGDVLGALPGALERLGHQPMLFVPAYREIRKCGLPIEQMNVTYEVPIGNKMVRGGLARGMLPGSRVPVFFIQQNEYFDREGLYAERNVGYTDNAERFIFFNRAVLEVIRMLDLPVDVVHCNDWHTALLPAYLKLELRSVPRFENVASLLTIHNMEHQGDFWHWDMLLTGLDWSHFNWREMEAFGRLNLLKAGLVYCDAVSTVSPRYAEEIQTPEFGCRLEGVLQNRRNELFGIINGVDYAIWNPATDKFLPVKYDPTNVKEGKAAAKAALQQKLGLEVRPDVPMFGLIGRLVEQKGVDVVLAVMQEWARSKDAQWAILGGDGDPKLGAELANLAKMFPQKVAARIEKSEELAHLIEAASDVFLMPSRFEPCGLNQLYSMKYGTLPLVHAVGGLADSVVDASPQNLQLGIATGFAFSGMSAMNLDATLNRAVDVFVNKPDAWSKIQQTAMEQDWSWDRSAKDYVGLYRQMMDAARNRPIVNT